jgi:hypothetical protein
MSTKELQEKIVAIMKRWQDIENTSVKSTADIIAKTSNPLLRLIMEIIQHDSQRHYHIQQFITDTLEHKAVSITPDEMASVWGMIEEHINIEKRTLDLAEMALQALKGKKMVAQEYLLSYLKKDEDKHNKMLEELNIIKNGMYPYG